MTVASRDWASIRLKGMRSVMLTPTAMTRPLGRTSSMAVSRVRALPTASKAMSVPARSVALADLFCLHAPDIDCGGGAQGLGDGEAAGVDVGDVDRLRRRRPGTPPGSGGRSGRRR